MIKYLRWSLRLLYLVVFWPTQFERETKGLEIAEQDFWLGDPLTVNQRANYLLKLLPVIIVVTMLGTVILGKSCEQIGISFAWPNSWIGMIQGLLQGLLMGLVGRLATGVTGSLTGGIAFAAAYGIVNDIPQDYLSVIERVGFWLYLSILFGLGTAAVEDTSQEGSGNRLFAILVLLVAFTFPTLALSMTHELSGVRQPTLVGGTEGVLAFALMTSTASSFLTDFAAVKDRITIGISMSIAIGLADAIANGSNQGFLTAIIFGLSYSSFFGVLYLRLLTYPIDAMISALVYISVLLRLNSVDRAWQACPIVWNERIWLPMPFAGTLLAMLARHNPEEGLRQISFIASERPLQYRVASKALIEAFFYQLQAKSISDIATISERFKSNYPLAHLPYQLPAVLYRFQRIGQLTEQYRALLNLYRKAEVMKRAIKDAQESAIQNTCSA